MKFNHFVFIALMAYATLMLGGCHTHQHEHGEHDHEHCEHSHEHSHGEHDHEHEHEEAEHHDHKAGEIVFSPEKAAAVGLQTEKIEMMPFEEALKVSGQIQTPANKVQTVVAATNGVITLARELNVGSTVKKGEVLAYISVRGMAEANPVETARIQYETARKEYERAQSLTGNQIVSAQEMEQITLRYQTAKAQYEALSDKAGDNGVAIRAPQNGYVDNLLFANGDYVQAGQALLNISQTNELLLQVSVPERYWNRLGSVRSANFVPAYSSETYRLADMNGRLLSVGRVATGQTGYVPVVFGFANKAGLVAGAYADVYLLLADKQEALSVPVSAVTEDQGVYSVYVQFDEDCYMKRDVTLGQSNGERVLVKSGLRAGETIVTKAALQVKLAGSATVIPGHTHNH